MTFVVDTNVLVYAANQHAPEHPKCRELLEEWRRRTERWYVTWSVIYEFVAATTTSGLIRPLRAEQAWSFVEALMQASPSLSLLVHTPEHGQALMSVLRGAREGVRGRFVHDAHIAALMLEHGVRTIYTRDRSFRRFPFLEVIDPLRA